MSDQRRTTGHEGLNDDTPRIDEAAGAWGPPDEPDDAGAATPPDADTTTTPADEEPLELEERPVRSTIYALAQPAAGPLAGDDSTPERPACGDPAKSDGATAYVGSSWRVYLLLGLIALTVTTILAWDRSFRRSDHPHFVYLADAYLNGHLDIRNPPEWMDDYVRHQDKWWVTFPPAPAVLMMPGLAACSHLKFDKVPVLDKLICGVPDHPRKGHPYFNDTFFTILFSVFNTLLMFRILEHLSRTGVSGRSRRDNLILWALFAFGTVHINCSVMGQVWYTALIFGVTGFLIMVLASFEGRHPVWAGLGLMLGFASRTPILMAFPIFFYLLTHEGDRYTPRSLGELIKKTFWFAVPVAVVGVLLMLHNYYRFGSIFEFGHDFIMKDRHLRSGMFGYDWLSRNLAASLVNFPRIVPDFPWFKFSLHGNSILWITPAWLYVFWPKKAGRFFIVLAATAIMVAMMSMLYKSTGFGQFGYRYNCDYAVPMIMMLALCGRRFGRFFLLLVGLSLFWNILGAIVFRRWDDLFFHWDLFPEMPFSRD